MDVNLIKLTNLERNVLAALAQSRGNDRYPQQGNDEYGISQILLPASLDPYLNLSLTSSTRSSLSRALNTLYRKGLVKKCTPSYRYVWHKRDDEVGLVGYFGKEYSLEMVVREAAQPAKLEFFGRRTLPRRVRYWWMLNEKGKSLISKEAADGQARTEV